ncbi:MAG TPA: DUF1552 domain-containing protein [Nannocystaceae bacterium]|nr:DUF1552 domain-containing protein [Nannocystaceae bacterium]
MFLHGAGGTLLAIPTLGSLLPRSGRAEPLGSPVRYVQWVTDHGQNADRFWPADWPTAEVAPGIKARALSEIAGPLSQVLGADFDPLRPKMNLLRGLDALAPSGLHNACVPTCCSAPPEDNHIPAFPWSVDQILETSAKVYPEVARVPALRLTPGVESSYKWGSFSWMRQNGEPFKLPAYDSNAAALEAVFGGGIPPMDDPVIAARVRLTDQVLEDYARVIASPKISKADAQQLTSYMDLLSEVQERMLAEAPDCSEPGQLDESDFEILHANAIDIAVIGMLCGATRVVAYHAYQGSPSSYDEETFHAWAHDDANLHAELQTWRYRQLAKLVARMDSVEDPAGGTLLDHSLVYACNELSHPGHAASDQRAPGSVHLVDMPVITFGAAGGRMMTGQYVDFGVRLLNNMLITIFDAMGLAPEDYERDGVVGFGDYQGQRAGEYAAYTSDDARRSPLPWIYT